ncbi:MAG: DUF1552 domain-containing protein [Planctomycetia bacterium]|nr:DUF1552 domain-containing protein [Planctomycetia bacterium]
MSFGGMISRRTALRGLGTAVALPLLDVMPLPRATAAEAGAASAPLRMAFVYVPNGVHMQDWTPKAEGENFELPSTLEPLGAFKNDLCVLTGLTQQKAFANGDGGGDHARALATFLTGRQARKTAGADIRIGVSVDQVAAEHVGRFTRFPSLELGCDAGQQSGNCDSGYSCAYSSNISWKSESTPMAKETNPRVVFERLFTNGRPGESAEARAKRQRYNKSVLDFVRDDAQSLRGRLGITDQRKFDEYLNAVRELEVRIARADEAVTSESAAGLARPAGIPGDYAAHIRIMEDLLVLAFQGDVTRVSTMVFANEGSNRSYPFIEVPEGHHDLSHHGNDEKKHEKIKKINRFHVTQFSHLLERLKGIKEGDGTLLDNCMIIYGSGIGDGNRHNHDDLPILLAGRGAGTIRPGRHVVYPNNTPLCNLYLSMLDRMGARCDSLGDSTARLANLDG